MRRLQPSLRPFVARSAIGVLLLTIGCRAVDPAYLTRDGRELAAVQPAPYRIAIAPVTWEAARSPIGAPSKTPRPLDLIYDMPSLRSRWLEQLDELNATSDIFTVGDSGLREARDGGADLYLRPRITNCEFQYEGSSPRQWIAWGLWLGTWLGGTFVEDSRYRAELQVDWDVINPHDGLLIDVVTTASQTQDLTFWERNGATAGTLESLILPPFWTTDDAARTSRSLSERASRRIAASLSGYLKQTLADEERQLLGELRIRHPANGATVGVRPLIVGRITATAPIGDVALYVNDAREPAAEIEPIDAVLQRRGNLYVFPIHTVIELERGRQRIVVEYSVGGHLTSRTLVVECDPNTESTLR